MRCPSFEQLIDSFDNALSEPDATRVAAHLASGCPACNETRDWYQQLRNVTASDDSVAPPAWVFKRAVRISDRALYRRNPGTTIGDLIASLVFDSFARPTLAGVRSMETVNRQLLYRAGDYSIDLQIVPSERARAELIGQVLKESDPGFKSVSSLKLNGARAGRVFFSATTDDKGEFRISGIEQGVYDLQIESAEGSITLADIQVGGP
jgi:hypothetical protein